MKNKIEEYLNGLDKKNLIMVYASVIIVFFIIYYNYNYSVLSEEIRSYDNKISKLQKKIKHNISNKKELVGLKKMMIELKKENVSLKEDLKYLSMLVKTSKILYINDEKFLDILNYILQKAISSNIKANYTLNVQTEKFKKYLIEIKGVFKAKQYIDFYNFIKSIESIKAVKVISNLKLEKKENIEFEIKVLFWSII